uniref:Uncharacterized protein n=1 Tax=Stomoxys calcitrans TaxID=35570 RepID=A0A1I8NYJ4_STOCA
MDKSQTTFLFLYLISSSCLMAYAAPRPQDLDDEEDVNGVNEVIPKFINQSLDYNAVVGHFKDFFMYLPVMFTTLKETMSGFPKFAEGVKILSSSIGPTPEEPNCKCKASTPTVLSSNDID